MHQQQRRSVLETFTLFLELILGVFFGVMVWGNRGYFRPGVAPEDVIWAVFLVGVALALFTALMASLLQFRRVMIRAQAFTAFALLVLSGIIVSDLIRDWKGFAPSPFVGATMALALAGFAGLFGWFAKILKSAD